MRDLRWYNPLNTLVADRNKQIIKLFLKNATLIKNKSILLRRKYLEGILVTNYRKYTFSYHQH